MGWGHRSASWPRQPTVRELDEVTGDRTVVLISGDGHHAWLNSSALAWLRLPARDGVVSESEWFRVYIHLGALVGDDGTSPDAYLHTMQQAAAKGVAGVVDLEFDQGVSAWPERELPAPSCSGSRSAPTSTPSPSSWPRVWGPVIRCPAAGPWSRWGR